MTDAELNSCYLFPGVQSKTINFEALPVSFLAPHIACSWAQTDISRACSSPFCWLRKHCPWQGKVESRSIRASHSCRGDPWKRWRSRIQCQKKLQAAWGIPSKESCAYLSPYANLQVVGPYSNITVSMLEKADSSSSSNMYPAINYPWEISLLYVGIISKEGESYEPHWIPKRHPLHLSMSCLCCPPPRPSLLKTISLDKVHTRGFYSSGDVAWGYRESRNK